MNGADDIADPQAVFGVGVFGAATALALPVTAR